jgi:hypothetical protein
MSNNLHHENCIRDCIKCPQIKNHCDICSKLSFRHKVNYDCHHIDNCNTHHNHMVNHCDKKYPCYDEPKKNNCNLVTYHTHTYNKCNPCYDVKPCHDHKKCDPCHDHKICDPCHDHKKYVDKCDPCHDHKKYVDKCDPCHKHKKHDECGNCDNYYYKWYNAIVNNHHDNDHHGHGNNHWSNNNTYGHENCNDCVNDCCDIKTEILCDKFINRNECNKKSGFKALTFIGEGRCIIYPEMMFNEYDDIISKPFIYDYKTKCKLSDVNIVDNGICINNITDATDMDDDGIIWLLSVRKSKCKKQSEKVSLIKVSYNSTTKTLTFEEKYVIPQCDKSTNYQGLASVTDSSFLLFSNGKAKSSKRGILYVVIDGSDVIMYKIKLSLNGCDLSDCDYDKLKITSASRTTDGLIIVPQNPEHLKKTVLFISNEELEKLENIDENTSIDNTTDCSTDVESGGTLEATIQKMCIKGLNKYNCGPNYIGIGGMTIDECGKVYAVTEWCDKCTSSTYGKPLYGKFFSS